MSGCRGTGLAWSYKSELIKKCLKNFTPLLSVSYKVIVTGCKMAVKYCLLR